MGLGAPRENQQPDKPLKPLTPETSRRLGEALQHFDQLHPDFKQGRDDERDAQRAKIWNRTCKEMDGHLRQVAKVLINSHQLNLDMGSDGGGRGTKPWIEETSSRFDRLYFRLEGDTVIASFGQDQEVGRGTIDGITYDWIEQAVVEWVIRSVQSATVGVLTG
ncbi:MAG: hypothetical protein KTR31_28905 [Myxococcales bacterium]|nr:hypothetical protein [Myxococcales bacterium]